MESQHVPNPWSFQQQLQHQQHHKDPSYTLLDHDGLAEQDVTLNAADHFHDPRNIFYHYSDDRMEDTDEPLHPSSHASHTRSWSYQETLTNSDHGDHDDPPDSPLTIIDSAPEESTLVVHERSGSVSRSEMRTLADSGVGSEGDMLEHLVERLQSEVADTRAIVFDLESRLNAAEHSNKHIVAELKTLLADAEGTLVGSDESDSGESVIGPKSGTASDEDTNAVYNRICHALQSLIAEAQSALMRTSPIVSLRERRNRCSRLPDSTHPPSQPRGQRLILSPPELFVEDIDGASGISCNHSSCRTSRRSSLTHTRTENTPMYLSVSSACSSTSRLSSYPGMSEFSRNIWKEKQQEQYERYRRSCDMISVELEMLLHDSAFDSDQSDTFDQVISPLLTTTGLFPASKDTALSSETSTHAQSTPKPLRKGSRAERLQRRYNVQLLSPQVRARRCRDERTFQPVPHYRNQGVGSSRSQSILMQIYGMWKQTWLRTRMMHILTGSFEVFLVMWVVLKISEASLAWMGIRLSRSREWMSYINGHRDGAGSMAKELYGKIRQDGLLMRLQSKALQEPESLLQDIISGSPSNPFTPTGMVLGPAKRMLAHTLTGLVLAYLSNHLQRLAKKI